MDASFIRKEKDVKQLLEEVEELLRTIMKVRP